MNNKEYQAVLNITAEQNQVKVTLESAKTRHMPNGTLIIMPQERVTNDSSEPIMRVRYRFIVTMPQGGEPVTAEREFYGEDTPLMPGTSVEVRLGGFQVPGDQLPAGIRVQITEVCTASELPPIRLPKPGDYLYQAMNDPKLAAIKEHPPVSITRVIDRSGAQLRTVFKAGNHLEEAISAFMKIRISRKPGMYVTDNYNRIIFEWEDGTKSGILLLMNNLQYNAGERSHVYALEDDREFFLLDSNYDRPRGRF